VAGSCARASGHALKAFGRCAGGSAASVSASTRSNSEHRMRLANPDGGGEAPPGGKRAGGKPGENGGKAIAHRKTEAAAALDHRKDGGNAGRGFGAADVDPVLAMRVTFFLTSAGRYTICLYSSNVWTIW